MEPLQHDFEAEIVQPPSLYQAPFIPRWSLMPLYKLCQQALRWHQAGYLEEAGKLVSFLLPLESFPTLWCPEKEYNESLTLDLFSQIKKITPIANDFQGFYEIKQNGCFTLQGQGTSLGVIRLNDVEIRAFGPQFTPLDFGIAGVGMDGWVRTFANPEVWMEWKQESEFSFDCKFVGLQDLSITMAFYVKAKECRVQDSLIQPKSLQRYKGETLSVIFDNAVKIETHSASKIEVIPLAGEGCFWDSEFLLKYEIHPSVPSKTFCFVMD